jgi:enterochelin esterase-like enzyme
MITQFSRAALALVFATVSAASVQGQVQTNVPPVVAGAKPVTVDRIKVKGKALEGNLEGNATEREVLVVLPPSYRAESSRRYPVVYALHGYSIGADQWSKEIRVPQTVEGAFGKGTKEMIVVLPDSKTVHNGSFYSNSITTGNFEDFISRDLVSYIDANYRTIANRNSRGLAGHSMGGYGATRIGMKHPDVFGSLYIMSPGGLAPRAAPAANPATDEAIAALKTREDVAKLSAAIKRQLAAAAAWSPNPKNPPLYLDLPVGDKAQVVLGKWAANAPLAFVDQYIQQLRQYRAIAMDVGDEDGLRVDSAKLHDMFDLYGIPNTFEIYSGNHTNNIAFRFQDFVLPFFGRTLAFEAPAR